MINTETERSQKVPGHDKACEKFHLGLPSAVQSYHTLETRSTGHEKTPPERGVAAALGAVRLGPHKAPLVSPAIHAAQHERAGRVNALETRPALPPPASDVAASGTGHLTRSRPQDSAIPSRHLTKGQRAS